MKPSEPPQGNRFTLAFTCAIVMYACAAGYGGYFVLHGSTSPLQYLGVILGLPAFASILFLLTAFNIPGLLAPGRLVFPLNLTLPPVFAAYLVLTKMLLTSTGSSIIIPFEKLRVASFWTKPEVLILVMASQMVCLTALTKLRSESVD
jgi:hypothetical protein